jgi:hypothetical protein
MKCQLVVVNVAGAVRAAGANPRGALLPFCASRIAFVAPNPASSQVRIPQIVKVTYVVGKESAAKIVNGSHCFGARG